MWILISKRGARYKSDLEGDSTQGDREEGYQLSPLYVNHYFVYDIQIVFEWINEWIELKATFVHIQDTTG